MPWKVMWIVVDVYNTLQEFATSAALRVYPNTKTMAATATLSNGDINRTVELIPDAQPLCPACYNYSLQKCNRQGDVMFEIVRVFKAVRIICPVRGRSTAVA
eukprot:scpid99732/ scgid8752/ 